MENGCIKSVYRKWEEQRALNAKTAKNCKDRKDEIRGK
jgi:hypothetical protein